MSSLAPPRHPSPSPPPATGSSPAPALSSLAPSSARLIIPLTSTTPAQAEPTPSTTAEESYSSPTMLLDFLSRIGRFEPRLRRYAAAKLTESGTEPVSAFSGVGSVAPTPARTPTRQTEGQGDVRGFSLVDLERVLLSVTPGWWKGKSGGNEERPPLRQTDSGGLDVDLSEVLGARRGGLPSRSASSSSSFAGPPQDTGPGLFLNYYSSSSLVTLLASSGVLSALADLGYDQPSLIFDTSDSFQHRLSLVDASLFTGSIPLSSQERFLIDLWMKRRRNYDLDAIVSYQLMKRVEKAGSWEKLREMTGEIRAPYVGVEGAREGAEFLEREVGKWRKEAKKGTGEWDVTEIAWMQMHDPLSKDTRPLLPGQRFPGLGMGRKVASVMESMATESKVTDALLNFPFHFHNAAAYRTRGWTHLDPIFEAYLDFLTTSLTPCIEEHGYSFVSWAVSLGHLRRITYEEALPYGSGSWTVLSNRLERWSPSEQVYPTSKGMKGFLESEEWRGMYETWREIFERDGGAMGVGVGVVEGTEGARRRAELRIDLEGCPELWKYSNVWSNRDPETGKFKINLNGELPPLVFGRM